MNLNYEEFKEKIKMILRIIWTKSTRIVEL
jgi:hypothetical protein